MVSFLGQIRQLAKCRAQLKVLSLNTCFCGAESVVVLSPLLAWKSLNLSVDACAACSSGATHDRIKNCVTPPRSVSVMVSILPTASI
jgi:hypothetical protein